MPFEPIAIIGHSCVLPGALSPSALWDAVIHKRDLLSTVPRGYWGLDEQRVLSTQSEERSSCARGGYVHGFEEVFDATGFMIPAERLAGLDPLFLWSLHSAREAMRSAGLDVFASNLGARAGVVLGNLGYPTSSLTRFAERQWLNASGLLGGEAAKLAGLDEVNPLNRFHFGYPARLVAQALGFSGSAFSLDAACASSLYAIKLACDRLHAGCADLMLAGAVNHADDLFIHMGFTALKAMSPNGRSRPFDRDADGLVPAEGAAFVVLKRLQDARQSEDPILGVIRGIGLANDGRSGGFLAPSIDGQVRAMRAAYLGGGIDPKMISLLECHATGTPVGDAVEVQSSTQIFRDRRELAVGSVKSNLGHLTSVAGLAGLIKILKALEHEQRPPSRDVIHPLTDFDNSPLRVLTQAEHWEGDTLRRGGVSAFGFGGNNAHLIVEQWREQTTIFSTSTSPRSDPDIAIIGVEVLSGLGDTDAFASALRDGVALGQTRLERLDVDLSGVRFAPADLDKALPQQLGVLEVVRRVVENLSSRLSESTGVYVGMNPDPEIARYSARWRLTDWLDKWRHVRRFDDAWLARAQDVFTRQLEPAGVIGTMPNIPANRLNIQFDFRGPSFTIGAEELSGLQALDVAVGMLKVGELDAAIVAAVDLSCEPVHESALAQVSKPSRCSGDAAVALVLKRLADARDAGDSVIATIKAVDESENAIKEPAAKVIGHAHAASGLLDVAAATVALRDRFDFGQSRPRLYGRSREMAITSAAFGGQRMTWLLRESESACIEARNTSRSSLVRVYSGASKDDVLKALQDECSAMDGPARLVITSAHGELDSRERLARTLLERAPAQTDGVQKIAPGIAWSSQPIDGEIAFCFGGAAAAYPGMGAELLTSIPELSRLLAQRFPILSRSSRWLNRADSTVAKDPFEVLKGSTLLSQIHALLSHDVLGLSPDAVLGVSSGETNSLFAIGAWRDLSAMFDEIEASGLYTREIAGEYQTARRAWGGQCPASIEWRNWRIRATPEEVEQALVGEEFCRVTMINSPCDVVIGGLATSIERVLKKVGKSATPVGHDIVAHCPEMNAWKKQWWALHHRETILSSARFYANALGGVCALDDSSVADVLTNQALATVDFRRVVDSAWRDGVRIFIEHGPRALCAKWINECLGGRPHLAVSFDSPGAGHEALLDALAQLTAAGISIDWATLERVWLGASVDSSAMQKTVRSFQAHGPTIRFMSDEDAVPAVESMCPAPWLPPVCRGMGPLAGDSSNSDNTFDDSYEPQGEAADGNVFVADGGERAQAVVGHTADIAKQMLAFHGDVVAAHRSFLALNERVVERILELRAQVTPGVARNASPVDVPVRPSSSHSMQHASNHQSSQTSMAANVDPGNDGGPVFTRDDLEVHAGGDISQIFGELFIPQAAYRRQVRMPEAPLLLTDRVTRLEGQAGSLSKGLVCTQTDVIDGAWYLHQGRMPAGIMVEAGQADLFLVSWLGVDLENRGERVYRLLGCELTFHGVLPRVGDRLEYEIHIDGYANQGPVRLFFFHYDCRINGELRLSVRNGQAGFFTDEELANSAGILWDPSTAEIAMHAQVAPARVQLNESRFNAEQVRAFSMGQVCDCFGDQFRATQSHVRTPRIQHGRMQLFDEVTIIDASGGPWKRGYLRAESVLECNEWFFDGHFKNDPCMPGTLMFEGCLQSMAFYLTALGFTIDKDGWRFEPVCDESYLLQCRGQVVPGARHLVYEVFVEQLEDSPYPTLTADLLCTVDGLAAFHCRGMKLRLIPCWPLESRLSVLDTTCRYSDVARVEALALDSNSIAACAWGRPSAAFGDQYAVFDDVRRCPRLPGPPYLFVSRVRSLDAEFGSLRAGGSVEVEYDFSPNAWYFSESVDGSMPFCVLLEAALQPCGWLASYTGFAWASDQDLFFRNLDGSGVVHALVSADAKTLRTRATLVSASTMGPVTIVSFDVTTSVGDDVVYSMTTSFGFFLDDSLASQVGLPTTSEQRRRVMEPCSQVHDLRSRPEYFFNQALRLPGPMLSLLDRITGVWPQGGKNALGRVRAEMDVDAEDWFFKCHFFGDPVQPGSLGIEAMVQALQCFCLDQKLDAGIVNPIFTPLDCGREIRWKYRGQVVPAHERVTVDVDVDCIERTMDDVRITASCSLWVDGTRIYEACLGVGIVSGQSAGDLILDPKADEWIADHCPTWTIPSLPMMSMVDLLADAAMRRTPGQKVVGVHDVRVRRWLSFSRGARRVKVNAVPCSTGKVHAELLVWDEEEARYLTVATGQVLVSDHFELGPKPSVRPNDMERQSDPYESALIFHGPSLQALEELWLGSDGASSWISADPGVLPLGALNPRLLDAATHGIPHDNLGKWSGAVAEDRAAYPIAVSNATFYGPAPRRGRIRCEARFNGWFAETYPRITLELIDGDRVWAQMEILEALFPKGPLGVLPPLSRRAFLRDRQFVAAAALAERESDATHLQRKVVEETDWLTGSVAQIYGVEASQVVAIAVKDHFAARYQLHPSMIEVAGDAGIALANSSALPVHQLRVTVTDDDDGVTIRDAGRPDWNLARIRAFWRNELGIGGWLGEDLLLSLAARFIRTVIVPSPETLAVVRDKGAVFVANHQVGVESVLFSIIASSLIERPVAVLAKLEHERSWIGELLATLFSKSELRRKPDLLILMDRDNQKDVLSKMTAQFESIDNEKRALLVHVHGTRSVRCGEPVSVVSSTLVDTAIARGIPIVPVRFAGGLPVSGNEKRLEYPWRYGTQDIWIGEALLPTTLSCFRSSDRGATVLNALNALGPTWSQEQPYEGDRSFERRVRERSLRVGVTEMQAVHWLCLEERMQQETASMSEETMTLVTDANSALSASSRAAGWAREVATPLFGLTFSRDG